MSFNCICNFSSYGYLVSICHSTGVCRPRHNSIGCIESDKWITGIWHCHRVHYVRRSTINGVLSELANGNRASSSSNSITLVRYWVRFFNIDIVFWWGGASCSFGKHNIPCASFLIWRTFGEDNDILWYGESNSIFGKVVWIPLNVVVVLNTAPNIVIIILGLLKNFRLWASNSSNTKFNIIIITFTSVGCDGVTSSGRLSFRCSNHIRCWRGAITVKCDYFVWWLAIIARIHRLQELK